METVERKAPKTTHFWNKKAPKALESSTFGAFNHLIYKMPRQKQVFTIIIGGSLGLLLRYLVEYRQAGAIRDYSVRNIFSYLLFTILTVGLFAAIADREWRKNND